MNGTTETTGTTGITAITATTGIIAIIAIIATTKIIGVLGITEITVTIGTTSHENTLKSHLEITLEKELVLFDLRKPMNLFQKSKKSIKI